MPRPSVQPDRSTLEERLSRFLLLSAFLVFSSFAIIIGWSYEQGQSEAGPTQQGITPPGAQPTVAQAAAVASETASIASPTARPTEPSGTAAPAPTKTQPEGTTPTAGPTSTTASDPSPTPALQERVIASETGLRSGQLEAIIRFADDTESIVVVTFDRDADDPAPRMHFAYTYEYTYSLGQSDGVHLFELERIVWGETLWQRKHGGPWIEEVEREDSTAMAERLLTRFLPRTDAALDVQHRSGVLTWHDPERNVDVTLEVDPDTGVPVRMTEADRGSERVLTVTYTGWNTAVEITPPG